jgi:predicted ATPase
VNVLSPAEIADEIEASLDILTSELRDAPPGQQSMRAAIARSWTLLDDQQRMAFRRLSIFRGGFTRDAAHTVAGAGMHMLQTLAGKSLLQYDRGAGRYYIHDLLHHYAREQLALSGEQAAIEEAHAACFADFMAERWPQMKGRRQNQALLEIEADLENVRTAWMYWVRERNASMLTKFLCSFWVVHDVRGWYPTGIELFARGIAAMRSQPGDDAQAGLGWLLAAQGLYMTVGEIASKDGFALAREGVEILMRLPRRQEMILPLISLFITAAQVSEYEVAAQATEDCLAVACATGDRWGIAKAKQFQAILAIEDGAYDRAEQLAGEALAIFEELGDNWSKSVVCIEILGLLAIRSHAFEAAKAWIERGLEAAHDTDFRYSQQMAHWQLGYIEALQQNYAEAGRHWHRARALGDRVVGAECFIGFGGMNLGQWGGRRLIPASNGLTKEE